MLEYIAIILVCFILVFFLVYIAWNLSWWQQEQSQRVKNISIVDLDEYKGLDKDLKNIYKKYFVNKIAPALMKKINQSTHSIKDQEKAISMYTDEIIKIINDLQPLTSDSKDTISSNKDIHIPDYSYSYSDD